MTLVLALALAALIGLSLGLLGAGGSILTVPVLVYLVGFEAKEAIAVSLAVVGATSLVGAYWSRRSVNWRVAAIFGPVAMAGTYGGARAAAYVTGSAQLALFALVMLAAAWFMFRGPRVPERPMPGPERRHAIPLVMLEGLGVGVLTGLVGVGGGFLIVPALVLLGGLGMKEAVGTSLVVIAMKSATGLVGYLGHVDPDWAFMGVFTAVAMAGIVAGANWMRRVPARSLQRAFGVLLLFAGTWMLYENRGAILSPAVPAAAATGTIEVER